MDTSDIKKRENPNFIVQQALLNNLLNNSQVKTGRLTTRNCVSGVIDDFYYALYKSYGVCDKILKTLQGKPLPEENKKAISEIERTLTNVPLVTVLTDEQTSVYVHYHSSRVVDGRGMVATKTAQVLPTKGIYNYKSFVDAMRALDLPSNPSGLWQVKSGPLCHGNILTMEINSFVLFPLLF